MYSPWFSKHKIGNKMFFPLKKNSDYIWLFKIKSLSKLSLMSLTCCGFHAICNPKIFGIRRGSGGGQSSKTIKKMNRWSQHSILGSEGNDPVLTFCEGKASLVFHAFFRMAWAGPEIDFKLSIRLGTSL